MASFYAKPTIELKVVMVLNEQEAGALQALAGYDFDAFLRTFKESLGAAYIEKYEEGLRTLFRDAYRLIPPHLIAAEEARKQFQKQ